MSHNAFVENRAHTVVTANSVSSGTSVTVPADAVVQSGAHPGVGEHCVSVTGGNDVRAQSGIQTNSTAHLYHRVDTRSSSVHSAPGKTGVRHKETVKKVGVGRGTKRRVRLSKKYRDLRRRRVFCYDIRSRICNHLANCLELLKNIVGSEHLSVIPLKQCVLSTTR